MNKCRELATLFHQEVHFFRQLASANMTASVCSSSNICFSTWLKTSCHLQWTSCFFDIFLHYPSHTHPDNFTDHFSNTYWSDARISLRGKSRHATRASTVNGPTISDASNLANRANYSLSFLFS